MRDDKLAGIICLGVVAVAAIAGACLTGSPTLTTALVSIGTTATGAIAGIVTGEKRQVLKTK